MNFLRPKTASFNLAQTVYTTPTAKIWKQNYKKRKNHKEKLNRMKLGSRITQKANAPLERARKPGAKTLII